MANLGVQIVSAVKVSIDALKDGSVDKIVLILKGVVEDYLKVGVV